VSEEMCWCVGVGGELVPLCVGVLLLVCQCVVC
jgi:hypothetical protein